MANDFLWHQMMMALVDYMKKPDFYLLQYLEILEGVVLKDVTL